MRIIGHGIDLVPVSRIAEMLAEHGERFLERCFSPAEQAYMASSPKHREHLAARFAAKEAAMKALGTGLADGVSWLDFEVSNNPAGKPALRVAGRAAAIAAERGISRWWISLSHTADAAMASVIAEGPSPAPPKPTM